MEDDRPVAAKSDPIDTKTGDHVVDIRFQVFFRPSRVMFKNYFQANALGFCQGDCTRVGGVSEFITVSLLARRYGIPVVPHVGDMGQIHPHLVLFNHIVVGHEIVFLEYIPHLREHFVHPARVQDGVYVTPQEPGSGTELRL